jgi:hypothetical protein
MRRSRDRTEKTKAAFRRRAAKLMAKNPSLPLRDAAHALGVAYITLRKFRSSDPELMRVMGGRRKPESPDSTLAIILEARRQGKIRAVRDVIVIGNIEWRSVKLRVASHEGWRKLMASVPFDENRDWRRTSKLRPTRTRPLYAKLVAELEAKGVPQPQASWQAVDTITDQDRAERWARADEVRREKWGDPRKNSFIPRNKPPMLKNDKVRRASAKNRFELLGTYNLVRALAWASGRTVDEEVRSTRPKALRTKYQMAVAEWRDGASSKEYERQKAEFARVRAERERRAASLRVRGKAKATAARNREAAKAKRRAEGLPATPEVNVIVQKY